MADYSDSSQREGEKLLEEAKARFKLAEEAWRDIRKEALEDLEFLTGKQWPDDIKAERARDGRPCLVINKLPQSVKQVTNDQRQNRPSIKIHPIDDRGDIETAKVIQGMIRHIEYNSSADAAYDTAFEHAASAGFGFWRVVTDYVSPLSFDQEILIKRIPNPFSVYFDPYSQEADGSDANWAFVTEDLSKDEYLAKYPSTKLAEAYKSGGGWESLGDQSPDWIKSDGCRVVEYFYKEFVEKEILLLSNGSTVLSEALPSQGLPTGVEVLKKRKAPVPVIKWCKLNGVEDIESTEWPGSYIPIVPVYGQEYNINGKRILEGIVRNARDPARMYNYWASAETEAIALAPRTPWIMVEGQDEGYEADWASANRRNHAVLKVKPLSINGQPAPLPQRNAFEPAVQAITQARMMAADDLKSTTGIYDAALGARSNETSGRAILARNNQAQTSNYHFNDNLTRSQKHTGRILIDLIPKIYDTERTIRIIGDEGDERVVKLNTEFEENGEVRIYDPSAGKYDVSVDLGPSFATKRQEAAQSMLEMTRAVPQIMQIAGDLLVKNMDWPGAQELAERLKKTLPPGLAEDKSKKPLPPEVQAQMQQMNQMVEQLTGKLNELQSEKEQKLLELESKERIEFKKLEVQLEIERAKLDAKDALALLSAEIAQIENRLQTLNIAAPIKSADQAEQPEQMAQPGQQQAQEFPMPQQPQASPDAGAPMGAEMPGEEMGMSEDLTGEESPGQFMEGPMQQ